LHACRSTLEDPPMEMRLSPEQAKALSVWLQNAAVEATRLEEKNVFA
jgi:hypothetical protein